MGALDLLGFPLNELSGGIDVLVLDVFRATMINLGGPAPRIGGGFRDLLRPYVGLFSDQIDHRSQRPTRLGVSEQLVRLPSQFVSSGHCSANVAGLQIDQIGALSVELRTDRCWNVALEPVFQTAQIEVAHRTFCHFRPITQTNFSPRLSRLINGFNGLDASRGGPA